MIEDWEEWNMNILDYYLWGGDKKGQALNIDGRQEGLDYLGFYLEVSIGD